MAGYRVELAGAEDDEQLRRVLAATPMPGAISVSFQREPSYFAASIVDGRDRQVLVARDAISQHVVGFGSRSLGMRYVNGQPTPVGYLSHLRLLPAHRSHGLVARGYALFRRLHEDGRALLYLTTIGHDNHASLSVLTSGRAGLPQYHFAGQYHTRVLRRRRSSHARHSATVAGVQVRPARTDDVPVIVRFLERAGSRRQFFPCYQAADFFTSSGAFRDLAPQDLMLAFYGDELVGTMGAWNQQAFRQQVVCGYSGALRWIRPFYNGWAWACGRPRLPRPGQSLRCLVAALALVKDDDPRMFRALLDVLLDQKNGRLWDYLLVGVHDSDPLRPVAEAYAGRSYVTNLYAVCWADGEPLWRALDGRPVYLELGSL